MRRKLEKSQMKTQHSLYEEDDSTDSRSTSSTTSKINPARARFPFSIVWTPLPLITWLIPVIGHTGIGMSDGVIHDFAGPYYISVDDLAFGEAHK